MTAVALLVALLALALASTACVFAWATLRGHNRIASDVAEVKDEITQHGIGLKKVVLRLEKAEKKTESVWSSAWTLFTKGLPL